MAPNPRRQDARLQALYDRVPAIKCKGHCHDACCFIDASTREIERMERSSGVKLTTVDAAAPNGPGSKVGHDGHILARYRCSMLTDDGRCSVYALRPMVCRLFGVMEGMECEYGCKPTRVLSAGEGIELLAEAMNVGGGGSWNGVLMRQMMESDEELRDQYMQLMRQRRGRS